LRRAAKLCVIFASNMAYYRAARVDGKKAAPPGNFWRTIDNNFIDACVLEWCKIFGDKNAKHSWTKLVTDAAEFEDALYDNIGRDAAAFAAEVATIRRYRDKFLAHLDSDRTAFIPHLDTMWQAAQLYYVHILGVEMDEPAARRVERDLGSSFSDYYNACFAEARKVYEEN
jgi:hypothetical protein